MKKTIILLSSLVSMIVLGQHHHEEGHYCAADEIRAELEKKHPEMKRQREMIEKKLQSQGVNSILKEFGFISNENPVEDLKTMDSELLNYTGKIYDIPIVIHYIENTANKNPVPKEFMPPTDEEIETWIENTNKIFATTYGNGFYPEGSGADGGAVIPFRLVLAKKSPNCEPTNGIIRYDGSKISDYLKGVKLDEGEGVDFKHIEELAPQWNPRYYFNIYLVNHIDKGKIAGYAYYPYVEDSIYKAVIGYTRVKNKHDTTLAHEIGHALGLQHVFGRKWKSTGCPDNTGNCTIDDDGVCDTASVKSLLGLPVPTNDDINTCSGKNYEGEQYNIMNYSRERRKFTPGQRDRALAMFLSQKGHLVNSLALEDVNKTRVDLTAPACSIKTASKRGIGMGITKVKMGDIDNGSESYLLSDTFYSDYSTFYCLTKSHTNIVAGKDATISIYKGRPIFRQQYASAWIDYNDNGVFESNEHIFTKQIEEKQDSYTHTFTVPTNAVQEKYLRMRVRIDYKELDACQSPEYGEVEDYAVRIVPENWQDPDDDNPPCTGH